MTRAPAGVQSPLLTGTQVRRRPSDETGMPVASTTFSSATRASCSSWILWMGSTLGSGVPPVATLRAKVRIISHWLGPLVPSMFMRSPSRDWNGLEGSPWSGGAITSCYGDDDSTGAAPLPAPRVTWICMVPDRAVRTAGRPGYRVGRCRAWSQVSGGIHTIPVDTGDHVAGVHSRRRRRAVRLHGIERAAPVGARSTHRWPGRRCRRS